MFLLFNLTFLTACACQPSKGEIITMEAIILNEKGKIIETKQLPKQAVAVKAFLAFISNKLFNQKQYEKTPPLLLKKLAQTNAPNFKEFKKTFYEKANHRFSPAQIITTKINKAGVPIEAVLDTNSSQTSFDRPLEVQYWYAKNWRIRLIFQKVRFIFPEQKTPPIERVAKSITLLNDDNKPTNNLLLSQFSVVLTLL